MQLDLLTKLILPIALFHIMLGMGLTLTLENFKRVLKTPRPVLIGIACQLIGLPLLGMLVVSVFPLSPDIALGLLILSFCPGGTTSNIFTYLFRGEVALSITLTAIVSLLAPFTVPFLIQLALLWFPEKTANVTLPIVPTILQLLAITGLPVALGMVLKHYRPVFSLRIEKPLRVFSVVGLFLIIALIVFQHRERMAEFFLLTGLASLALNLLAMSLGFFVARIMRLSRAESITIGFEVGIQNGTTALLITGGLIGVAEMTIAPVTYSLLMFVTGFLFGKLLDRIGRDTPSAAHL